MGECGGVFVAGELGGHRECNLMILQLESQSRIGLTQRSAISAMASTSIVGELGRGLDLNVVTTL